MKVLYACGIDLTRQFAGTVRVMNTTRVLKKLGHEVVILAPSYGKTPSGFDAHVMLVPTTNIRFVRTFLLVFLYPLFFMGAILSFRPDIVYERELGLVAIAHITKAFSKAKHIVELNGFLPGDMKGSIKSGWIYLCERSTFRWAYAVSAPGKGFVEQYAALYGLSFTPFLLPNSYNEEIFRPAPKSYSCTRSMLDPSLKYVAYTGTFYPFHGLAELVEAAGDVTKKFPDVRFLLVGDGEILPEIIELVKTRGLSDKFLFPGEVPHKKIADLINASDVCYLVNDHVKRGYKGLNPAKLPEYLACGKPVVVSDDMEFEGIETCSISVQPGPNLANEVRDALIRLLGDADLREKLGAAGIEAAEKNYSYLHNVTKLAKELEAACQK